MSSKNVLGEIQKRKIPICIRFRFTVICTSLFPLPEAPEAQLMKFLSKSLYEKASEETLDKLADFSLGSRFSVY